MVDGRYIDSQRNSSKKWDGSDNQRIIDIQKSLQQDRLILYSMNLLVIKSVTTLKFDMNLCCYLLVIHILMFK